MQPVRDVFAAVFFVSVGMLIDPALVAAALGAVVVLTLVVVVGKIVGVVARRVPHRQRHAHRRPGRHEPGADRRVLVHHRRRSGSTLGATRDFLYPVAVAVSAITTLTRRG